MYKNFSTNVDKIFIPIDSHFCEMIHIEDVNVRCITFRVRSTINFGMLVKVIVKVKSQQFRYELV